MGHKILGLNANYQFHAIHMEVGEIDTINLILIGHLGLETSCVPFRRKYKKFFHLPVFLAR